MAEPVRAGPLSAVLADGALRDVRLLGYRALDAVYVAVRDSAWNTIPGSVSDFRMAGNNEGCTATWHCVHRAADVEFAWRGSIEASGTEIAFRLEGEALSEFEINRIGFCLLHPIELTGTVIEVAYPDGGHGPAVFPVQVSPGPILTGASGLSYQAGPGARLGISFTGGRLETEDHRNWTDPGWKTYTPPLADPAPWRMRPGDRIRQAVTLRARSGHRAAPAAQPPPASEVASLRLGPADGVLPELGVVTGGRDGPSLRRLAPSVIHIQLNDGEDWRARLALAADRAAQLGGQLSVALVGPDPAWLAACARVLPELAAPVVAVGVFAPPDGIAPAGAARLVREQLPPGVAVGGGSLLHFAELNRAAARDPDWDFVMFPVTPQVHHTDDASVLSTILGQEPAVRDAAGGLPVIVGPVSLRRRTGQFTPASPDDPRDPRECEPAGIAWLCATVIAMHAAEKIIFLNPAVGAPDTAGQPAASEPAASDCAGAERVFATLARLAGQPVLRVECDRRRLAALAVRRPGAPPLLVVSNLTPGPLTIQLGHRTWTLRAYEAAVLDTGQ
jgi:D-apionolactonase